MTDCLIIGSPNYKERRLTQLLGQFCPQDAVVLGDTIAEVWASKTFPS